MENTTPMPDSKASSQLPIVPPTDHDKKIAFAEGEMNNDVKLQDDTEKNHLNPLPSEKDAK